ncbi:MAG: acetamidase/formamidase family protein [Eubacteriaceae bacterium]|nr:acetamidase/formamidase family protein [Eubacteriaceae bacterium]
MRITRDHVIYTMDKNNDPVATAKSGDSLIFETCDCFHDTVLTQEDLVSQINFDRVNPATGPVYVEGAEVGDALKVKISRITLAEQGAIVTAPGLGRLANEIKQEETVICKVDEDYVYYQDLKIPLNKMIGVIGTAPAGDGIATGIPDAHGGNMDTPMIREGAALYLPVHVEGALLAMGDLHAAMGDGEIMGAGLEIQGEVEVEIEVIKNCDYPLPLIETETSWITVGSAENMEEASDIAIRHMVDLLQKKTTFTFNEAGMLLSLAGNLKASQVVNPNRTMRMELDKKYF